MNIDFSEVKNFWNTYNKLKTDRDFLSLYVHIPQCAQKCDFCIYGSEAEKTEEELDTYLDSIESMAFKYKNVFKDTKIKGLYIGGGSPTILSHTQLDRLFGIIDDNFSIDYSDDAFRGIEITSYLTDYEKINTILKHNINRISIGVQSFDKETCESNNRPWVSYDRFKELVSYIPSHINLNVDLITGIKQEDDDDIFDSFEKLLSHDILRITLYRNKLTDPSFKDYFIQLTYKLNEIATSYGYDALDKLGHTISNITWAKNYQNRRFKYSYGFSDISYNAILGLGRGASSRTPFQHRYIVQNTNNGFRQSDFNPNLLEKAKYNRRNDIDKNIKYHF